MALYVSTPVGTKAEDVQRRKALLNSTLPNYNFKGMEIWLRGDNPENSWRVKQMLEDILGKSHQRDYFLTVQARRRDPKGSDDRFEPSNYYDITTQKGVDNLLVNAKAAKDIGAMALVAAPWIGVFKYPRDYKDEFENPDCRKDMVNLAVKNAEKVSKEVGIRVALEHPTVPLYGDFNPNIADSMFDLGFGLFEHTKQVPGEMLVLDTCHIESARNIVERLKNNRLSFVPGIMNSQEQPSVFDAMKIARPFEVHYAGFGGKWEPYSDQPTTHMEGSVPGGENDNIKEKTFRNITRHLKTRAETEDIIIVAEPNDKDFMNPVNAEETLGKIYSWIKEK
jgi:hypothetical protein